MDFLKGRVFASLLDSDGAGPGGLVALDGERQDTIPELRCHAIWIEVFVETDPQFVTGRLRRSVVHFPIFRRGVVSLRNNRENPLFGRKMDVLLSDAR